MSETLQMEAERLYPIASDDNKQLQQLRRLAYTAGATRNAWVSISERLPDTSEDWTHDYIVYDGHKQFICSWGTHRVVPTWVDENDCNVVGITHWWSQKLPAKPE